jgi:hypothetical protein
MTPMIAPETSSDASTGTGNQPAKLTGLRPLFALNKVTPTVFDVKKNSYLRLNFINGENK